MNILVVLLAASLAGPAHAGWLKRICEAIIQDDPYQFEQVPDEVLLQRIDQLVVRSRHAPLPKMEQLELDLIRRERLKRVRLTASENDVRH